MPLSRIQSEVLSILAGHRDPESYVAGAAALNVEGPRYSRDIDIFHDREEAVAQAAEADVALLIGRGYSVRWLRREPGLHVALTEKDGETTRLEWARDSDFRFFPAIRDDLFGYRLHVFDLATNKVLAAAGRREPRDVVDLLHIHERHVPLGAVIWAAVAKDPGFSPESLIAEIRRNARYRADDYADLDVTAPIDAGAVARRLRSSLEEAEAFARTMPHGTEGLAFLRGDMPVQPDPRQIDAYLRHAGARRGHWPSSPDIASAMLQSTPQPKP